MTDLLKELEAVVALQVARILAMGVNIPPARRAAESAALRFVVTRHTEIAEALADAAKWRKFVAGVDADQLVYASDKYGDAMGVLKDARRWRHARTILPVEYIEDSQREFESFGLPVSEEESIAADEAIDAAMRDSAREAGE